MEKFRILTRWSGALALKSISTEVLNDSSGSMGLATFMSLSGDRYRLHKESLLEASADTALDN